MSDCTLRLELVPAVGYVCTGSCGESLAFGVNQTLRPQDLTDGCVSFRDQVLRAFGDGGTRRLTEELEPPYDGFPALGRRSAEPLRGTVMDALQELFERSGQG